MKYIIWADERKNEAVVVEAESQWDAVEIGADMFDVTPDQVNTVDADRLGEAEYYGVAHALKD